MSGLEGASRAEGGNPRGVAGISGRVGSPIVGLVGGSLFVC